MDGLTAGRAFLDLVPRMKPGYRADVERELGKVDGTSSGASVGKKFSGALGSALKFGAAAVAAKVGVDLVKGSIDAASDLNEVVSKSRAIFGGQSAAIEKWAGGAATAIGQSKREALDAAAGYGNLFDQLGIGKKQAGDLSVEMVNLASDFASFHNADISDVISAQSAAFRGEYDAVQRYVPTINAAAVEQRALADSGKKTTKELTAQDKALAVQKLLVEGAGKATGDFARTSDGLANKQRILAAKVENLKAKLGQALLPIVTKVTGFLADNMEPALAKVGDVFGYVAETVRQIAVPVKAFLTTLRTGFTEDEGTPIELFALTIREKLLPILEKVAGFVKSNLKPILIALGATLAVLLSPVGAIVAALVIAYTRFEGFRNVVDAVIRFLVEQVAPRVAIFVGYIAGQFSNLVRWVREHWAAIQEAVSHVVNVIVEIVTRVIDVIVGAWRMWGDNLLTIAKAIWDQIQLVIKTAVDLIRGVIEFVLAVINGDWGKAWDALLGIVRTILGYIVGTIENIVPTLVSLFSGAMELVGRAVSTGLDKAVGFFVGLPGRFARAAGNLFGFIAENLKGALNAVISVWNDFKIPSVKIGGWDPPGPGPKIPSFHTPEINFPNLPLLARGGRATRSGLAIVGDDGPELVDLSRGATVTPLDVAAMIAEAGERGGDGSLFRDVIVPTAADATADEVVDAIAAKLGWKLTTRKDR